MNIIVTIPKSETANIIKEDEFVENNVNCWQYWSIKKIPKKLLLGDRVYFTHNNFINYYHFFEGIEENIYCQVTGRTWYGLNLKLRCPKIIIEPIPYRGFQGFRYYN
jgi:hypothetical protein